MCTILERSFCKITANTEFILKVATEMDRVGNKFNGFTNLAVVAYWANIETAINIASF